jgi:hypothetical protein
MPNPENPGLVTKAFSPAEVNLTPGERSDVSWISTDVVDNEGDVVVAKGVDFASVYLKNPVVMACHDYQKWPVGTCAWIKAAKGDGFTGLCAKTMYDEDPDAVRLFGMVQRKLVRGRSIGFRPPSDFQPGDWGAPTPDELKARPDWKNAGRIIRRCVLLEYSVVPIPMNQESLTVAVSKGLELPSYLAALVEGKSESPSYGYCPKCGAKGVERERRTDGNDKCENGHVYPSKDALDMPIEDMIRSIPPHRTLAQVQADFERRLARAFDPAKLAEAAVKAALDRARGAI